MILFIGFFFYLLNYFLYKNELIYCTLNPYESGGVFWREATKLILFSVITFQIFTFVVISNKTNMLIFLLLVPLLGIDYYFYKGLKDLFTANCRNIPINEPEETFLDNFSRNVLKNRKKYLEDWGELRIDNTEDNLPITEMGLHDKQPKFDTNSYYRDPATLETYNELLLPAKFFKSIKFILTYDQNNVYEMKLDNENSYSFF
ncbi:hypothetical protein HERIO_402 [Hepatospora eriocheir]|uniref:CSC1/OSCA1-like 7TM region domain-containing protein n=1 Tax=Hepatospora eriocheir TaxID=1081669 RepID=A0A1X0QD69_9MICR|nr:hypothetical protein HERIO_402 [Hepatospora eriocheir]